MSLDNAKEVLTEAIHRWGKDCLVTSALGAGGVLLLAWLNEIDKDHPCYLVDTGWLFSETLAYKDYLVAKFGFNIVTVERATSKKKMDEAHGPKLYKTNPDLCCHILKVEPVQKLLKNKKAWVSAPRREQGGNRVGLEETRVDDMGIVRVYPLALVSREEIDTELDRRGIMQHPLRRFGYESIGCTHCTHPTEGNERSGRWAGQCKIECGLHFRPDQKEKEGPKAE